MTFAQKLKSLRKEHHYSQEELAQILDVSRQAVSKWESDRGIPETDKLIQLSTIFEVTLDYLLRNDHFEDNQHITGYYVSREIIEGFLSYKRQVAKRISIGISLILLSNVFTSIFNQSQLAMTLYWLTLALGIATLIWHIFQPMRYQEIGTKQLLFDDDTLKQFRLAHEKNRKRYVLMIIVAVSIFIISPQIIFLFSENPDNSIGFAFSWILHAIWVSLITIAGIALHAENIIAQNTEYMLKKDKKGKYAWIYVALPTTAFAVAIGIFTNAWSPIVPIIVLFCVLLVTVCKLLIEGRNSK